MFNLESTLKLFLYLTKTGPFAAGPQAPPTPGAFAVYFTSVCARKFCDSYYFYCSQWPFKIVKGVLSIFFFKSWKPLFVILSVELHHTWPDLLNVLVEHCKTVSSSGPVETPQQAVRWARRGSDLRGLAQPSPSVGPRASCSLFKMGDSRHCRQGRMSDCAGHRERSPWGGVAGASPAPVSLGTELCGRTDLRGSAVTGLALCRML